MKTKVLSLIGVFLLGLGIGRFTLPAKVVTKIQTVEVDKTQDTRQLNRQDNSITTVTKTKSKDGTEVTVTKTENNIKTDTTNKLTQTDNKQSQSEKTVEYDTGRWSLAAAIVTKLSAPSLNYGGVIQYRILGPIQVGGMAFSDGTVGVSAGIRF
jgi:hypothetical protein